MNVKSKISIQRICERYEVDRGFLLSISEMDLITVFEEGAEQYIAADELPLVERMMRLHLDLGINHEGLHTIHHMLERMEGMQEEIRQLRNRLSRYEDW